MIDAISRRLISQRCIHFMHSIYRRLSKSDTTCTDWRKSFCGAPPMIYMFVWPLTRLCVCNHDWSVQHIRWNLCVGLLHLQSSVNTDRFTYTDEIMRSRGDFASSSEKYLAFHSDRVKKENHHTYASLNSAQFISFPRGLRREIFRRFRESFTWIGSPPSNLYIEALETSN